MVCGLAVPLCCCTPVQRSPFDAAKYSTYFISALHTCALWYGFFCSLCPWRRKSSLTEDGRGPLAPARPEPLYFLISRLFVAFQRHMPPSPPCREVWRQLAILRDLHSHITISQRCPKINLLTNACRVAAGVTDLSKISFFLEAREDRLHFEATFLPWCLYSQKFKMWCGWSFPLYCFKTM